MMSSVPGRGVELRSDIMHRLRWKLFILKRLRGVTWGIEGPIGRTNKTRAQTDSESGDLLVTPGDRDLWQLPSPSSTYG